MVFMPRRNVNKPAIIVELKWNKTASAAIEQIMLMFSKEAKPKYKHRQ